MVIELPGYRTVFPNVVYTRKENQNLPGRSEFKGTRVLLFHRYTEATEDEVILYLQAKERGLPSDVPSPAVLRTLSYLERAIIGLPAEERGRLRSGYPELMTFLRGNTSARSLDVGEVPSQYLTLTKGLIPTEMLEENERRGNVTTAAWYQKALQDDDLKRARMGEQWEMRMKYTGEGLLPRSEMDLLLKHGVFGSETVYISLRLRNEIYRDIVDTLYAGFPTPNKIALLEDVSLRVLENAATESIQALLAYVQRNSLMQAISSGDIVVLGGEPSPSTVGGNSGGKREKDPKNRPN